MKKMIQVCWILKKENFKVGIMYTCAELHVLNIHTMQIWIGKIRKSMPWNLRILKIGFVGDFNSANLLGCVNVNLLGHVSVNFAGEVFPILPIY
jgi:hypothetical protein